jgi:CMP-N-acetylneuraminic acid synthetase
VLALIPARAGSKGVPGKNIRPLGDRPLIAYTIEAARTARRITRVIVSTDSSEIAEVARRCGADVPFLRPADLATDAAPMIDVITHALATLRQQDGRDPEIVVLLQPTVPFRTAAEIDRAVTRLEEEDTDAVVTVRPVPAHFNPAWQLRIDAGELRRVAGGPLRSLPVRRQDLEPTYIRDGSIYAVKTAALTDSGSLYGHRTSAVIAEHEAINIDSEDDWRRAEAAL